MASRRLAGETLQKIATYYGCSRENIRQLLDKYYPWISAPEKIKSYLKRHCHICGKEVPKGRRSLCGVECYKQASRYRNLSEEQRKAHLVLVRRWQSEHPEAFRQIVRKASRRYSIKKHKDDKFMVVGGKQIPLGTIIPRENVLNGIAYYIKVIWQGKEYNLRKGKHIRLCQNEKQGRRKIISRAREDRKSVV